MTTKDYSCRTVRHMLPLHVGGDLDPRHVDAVDNHVQHCLSCFREFRSYASMRSRLGVLAEERLPEGVLEGFTEEVMARVAVGEPGPAATAPGSPVIRWPVLPRLAMAAAVLIVCVAGWRYMSDSALTPGDRPPTASPLAPSSSVGRVSQPATSVPLTSIPLEQLRGSVSPQQDALVSPGLQGLRPPSRAEAMLIQQAADAGMIILLPDASQPSEAAPDKAAALLPQGR